MGGGATGAGAVSAAEGRTGSSAGSGGVCAPGPGVATGAAAGCEAADPGVAAGTAGFAARGDSVTAGGLAGLAGATTAAGGVGSCAGLVSGVSMPLPSNSQAPAMPATAPTSSEGSSQLSDRSWSGAVVSRSRSTRARFAGEFEGAVRRESACVSGLPEAGRGVLAARAFLRRCRVLCSRPSRRISCSGGSSIEGCSGLKLSCPAAGASVFLRVI